MKTFEFMDFSSDTLIGKWNVGDPGACHCLYPLLRFSEDAIPRAKNGPQTKSWVLTIPDYKVLYEQDKEAAQKQAIQLLRDFCKHFLDATESAE